MWQILFSLFIYHIERNKVAPEGEQKMYSSSLMLCSAPRPMGVNAALGL
jgi:hypothetical protein